MKSNHKSWVPVIRIGLILIFFTASRVAQAADIRPGATLLEDGIAVLQTINYSGGVTQGDAQKIDRLVKFDDSAIVFLNSSGGDYREGLKLAQLFFSRNIRTALASGASCLSACAIAFLGGSASGEEGLKFFARSVSLTSKLGFHAPFLDVGSGVLGAEAVEAAYDHAIKTVTDFVRAAGPLGISPDVAADMMTPQRASLFIVKTVRDLVRVGIEVHGVAPPQVLTRTMVANLCINNWIQPDGDWKEAENTMLLVAEDLQWPTENTIVVRSGYMSADVVDVKRTVLPMSEAGEGSGYYLCLLDHAMIDGELKVAARGFVFLPSEFPDLVQSGLDVARGFDPGETDYGQPQFEAKFAIASVEPLDRTIEGGDLRFGIVPIDTEIGDIARTVEKYLSAEPPL